MSLCGYVLYIQLKKWYVKFGATGSLSFLLEISQRKLGKKLLQKFSLQTK